MASGVGKHKYVMGFLQEYEGKQTGGKTPSTSPSTGGYLQQHLNTVTPPKTSPTKLPKATPTTVPLAKPVAASKPVISPQDKARQTLLERAGSGVKNIAGAVFKFITPTTRANEVDRVVQQVKPASNTLTITPGQKKLTPEQLKLVTPTMTQREPSQSATIKVAKPPSDKDTKTFLSKLGAAWNVGVETTKGNIKNTASLFLSKLEEDAKESEKEFRERAKRNPQIYNEKFFKEREKAFGALSSTAQKIKDSASKNFERASVIRKESLPVDERKFSEKVRDPQWIASSVVETLPTMLTSLGISAGTLALTKNPNLALTAGFSSSFAQEAGAAYKDARDFGVDEKTARNVAVTVGIGAGFLETLPIAKLLDRTGGDAIKRKMIREITARVAKQSALESGTESLQEIVANVAAKTYDENREFFSGVPEAALIGGILGSGSEVVASIVDRSVDGEVRPQDVISVVLEKNAQNTTEGRELIKLAAEARDRGENISVDPDGEFRIQAQEKSIDVPDTFRSDEEKTSLKELAGDPDGYITKYLEKNTKSDGTIHINSDRGMEVNPGYKGTNTTDYTVFGGNLARLAFNKALDMKSSLPKDEKIVLMLAGGTGSGKTSVSKATEGKYPIQFDSTLSNYARGVRNIEEALGKDFDVDIRYVYRDPVKAYEEGVLRRYDEGERRTVPITTHIAAHANANEVIQRLAEEYKDSDGVSIEYWDNSAGYGEAKEVDLDFVSQIEYNKEELAKELYDRTKRALDRGTITEEEFEALTKGALKEGSDTVQPRNETEGETPRDKPEASRETVTPEADNPRDIPAKLNPPIKHPDILGFQDTDYVTPIEKNGKVVGGVDSVINRYNPDSLIVNHIRIIPEEQGKGLGTEAVKKLFNDNPEINQIQGHATAESRSFWEKLGAKFNDNSTAFTISRDKLKSKSQLTDIYNEAKEEKDAPQEPVNPEIPKTDRPVGEEGKKKSRYYERLENSLEEEYRRKNVEYTQMSLKKDAEKAIKFLEEKPEEALKVAYGLAKPPEGQTSFGVSLAVLAKAEEEGKYDIVSDLLSNVSLRATRLGQEIVSLRGNVLDDSPQNYMRELLNRRYNNIGSSITTDLVAKIKKDALSPKARVIQKIDRKVDRIREKYIKRETDAVKLAQDFFEALKC